MRVTLLLMATLSVASLGCSKPKEPQPTPAELTRAAANIREQERALGHAQAEERNESLAEALNEIDQNVQNVHD